MDGMSQATPVKADPMDSVDSASTPAKGGPTHEHDLKSSVHKRPDKNLKRRHEASDGEERCTPPSLAMIMVVGLLKEAVSNGAPAKDSDKDAKDDAKDNAKDDAKDSDKDAKDNAKDSDKDAKDDAKDSDKDAKDLDCDGKGVKARRKIPFTNSHYYPEKKRYSAAYTLRLSSEQESSSFLKALTEGFFYASPANPIPPRAAPVMSRDTSPTPNDTACVGRW